VQRISYLLFVLRNLADGGILHRHLINLPYHCLFIDCSGSPSDNASGASGYVCRLAHKQVLVSVSFTLFYVILQPICTKNVRIKK